MNDGVGAVRAEEEFKGEPKVLDAPNDGWCALLNLMALPQYITIAQEDNYRRGRGWDQVSRWLRQWH
jgi:hypothetical protein